jgi:hypothetical protein
MSQLRKMSHFRMYRMYRMSRMSRMSQLRVRGWSCKTVERSSRRILGTNQNVRLDEGGGFGMQQSKSQDEKPEVQQYNRLRQPGMHVAYILGSSTITGSSTISRKFNKNMATLQQMPIKTPQNKCVVSAMTTGAAGWLASSSHLSFQKIGPCCALKEASYAARAYVLGGRGRVWLRV